MVVALGGMSWPTAVFRAIYERYLNTGSPSGITVIAPAGQGGRGLIPWSIDDLSKLPGLVKRFITGHLETFKWTKKAAAAGRICLHCIHQGALVQLVGRLAKGENVFWTQAGLGTAYGAKSAMTEPEEQFVETVDGQVRVTCPALDANSVVVVVATYADEGGGLYSDNVVSEGEAEAAAEAVHRQGGIVIAEVGGVIPLRAQPARFMADYVVVRPDARQVLCFTQRAPFWALIAGARYNVARAFAIIGFINRLAKLTPQRGPLDCMVARAAAFILAKQVKAGVKGNVGVGLPEMVVVEGERAGIMSKLHLVVESGPLGGRPTSGGFFGAEVNPTEIRSSVQVFQEIEKEGLDFTILGLLEADYAGNGNSSRWSDRIEDLVGPGGAITIASAAKQIFLVLRLRDKKGQLRFVEPVREVTLSGPEALRRGKQVFFITDCGVIQLTADGLKLIYRMPNFPLKDILELLPFVSLSDDLEVLPESVVTGQNFKLTLAA
jgi:acyl CoA:acetate/3-ketoacid CoA transferase